MRTTLRLVCVPVLALLTAAAAGCGDREKPIKIKQRTEVEIAPDVMLKVGDIELDNGAFLTVVSKGKPIVQTDAREGDVVPFKTGRDSWEIEVVQLENHLMHEDYIHLFVRKK